MALVELFLAAEQVGARDHAVVEVHVGGVRGAQAVLLDLGTLLDALGPDRHDERRVTARAELGIGLGDHDVHVGDTAVGRPGLLAVERPGVVGLVVLRGRADRADVRAGARLRGAEGCDLEVTFGAVALRHPLLDLLPRALACDRGDREPGAHDRHAKASVTPKQLLLHDRHREAGLVGGELLHRLKAVEADLVGLLDDRPRRLLALVPFVGGGAHDVLSEPVGPGLDVLLLLRELKGESRLLLFGCGHNHNPTSG